MYTNPLFTNPIYHILTQHPPRHRESIDGDTSWDPYESEGFSTITTASEDNVSSVSDAERQNTAAALAAAKKRQRVTVGIFFGVLLVTILLFSFFGGTLLQPARPQALQPLVFLSDLRFDAQYVADGSAAFVSVEASCHAAAATAPNPTVRLSLLFSSPHPP